MLKTSWITEEAYTTPQQAFFQRAARTDKGVSAARQVVSVKLRELRTSTSEEHRDLIIIYFEQPTKPTSKL